MEAIDGRRPDRSVHPLNFAVGPRVLRFVQAMLDPVGFTDQVEAHRLGVDAVPFSGLLCKLDTVVGQDGVDLISQCFEHALQQLLSGFSVGWCNELCDDKFNSPADAHKDVEPFLQSLHRGDVDVENADRVAPELLPFGFSSSTSGRREMQ